MRGALLTIIASGLGCGPRASVLVGLAYGLATPAFVYATLFYGHQATAFLLLASLAAIERSPNSWRWSIVAGLCASYAAVVEIQAGPVSAILGLALLGNVLAGAASGPRALLGFAVEAHSGPVLVLLGYNVAAFGSPFDMGYFHEDLNQFRQVHSADNPLGLGGIKLSLIPALLWGEFRGLLAYAPILILAVPGWLVLATKRRWNLLIVSLSACACVFLVPTLSCIPTGPSGWSTGPRFLLPLIPFGMLAVAAILSVGGRSVVAVAISLAVFGGLEHVALPGVSAEAHPRRRGPGLSAPPPRSRLAYMAGRPVAALERRHPLRADGWRPSVREARREPQRRVAMARVRALYRGARHCDRANRVLIENQHKIAGMMSRFHRQ